MFVAEKKVHDDGDQRDKDGGSERFVWIGGSRGDPERQDRSEETREQRPHVAAPPPQQEPPGRQETDDAHP